MHKSEVTTRVAIVVPTLGKRDVVGTLQEVTRQSDEVPEECKLFLLHNSPVASEDLINLTKRFDATYYQVPGLGFASVRNAALACAQAFDVLVFIDDDELPETGWLSAHLRALRDWNSDVTFGPVRVVAPSNAPKWLAGGRLLREEVLRPAGPTTAEVYSGNTALRMELVRRVGVSFSASYDKTGGEDTDFFERCRQAGASVVWCPEAAVLEEPDPERLEIKWFLTRSYTSAKRSAKQTRTKGHRAVATLALRKLVQLVRGSFRLTGGLITLSPPLAARGARDLALAAGSLHGILPTR